jgi:hypothetical protein
MTTPPTALSRAEVERLTRCGLRLTQFTVAYNVIEAAVAITAGLLAGLVSLVGFGLDSGIESAAAVLVGLRLSARHRPLPQLRTDLLMRVWRLAWLREHHPLLATADGIGLRSLANRG